MKKIPTLYLRDPDDMKHVTDEVNPFCQWVIDGEGVATRKYDGTCVMLDDLGKWWARREVKMDKQIPDGFQLVHFDAETGKSVGWEPIEQSPFVKFFTEAYHGGMPAGTYELCGPKINGNPEGFEEHRLISHDTADIIDFDLDPRSMVRYVCDLRGWEGIVWHHPDGRMAKLKGRDLP